MNFGIVVKLCTSPKVMYTFARDSMIHIASWMGISMDLPLQTLQYIKYEFSQIHSTSFK